MKSLVDILIRSKQDLILVSHYVIDFLTHKTHRHEIASKEFISHNLEFITVYLAGIFKSYFLNEINKNELILSLPNLTEEYQQALLEAIEARRYEVSKFLLFEHNSQYQNVLNFDWELNWVIGSSTMASIREQLATLILNFKKGNEMKCLSLEIDKAMLEKLIKVIEITQN